MTRWSAGALKEAVATEFPATSCAQATVALGLDRDGVVKEAGVVRLARAQRQPVREERHGLAVAVDRRMKDVQPPQQGQFTASGQQLADNGMGQSGAPSSGSAPFWAR